jgi:hypothetical protein
MPIALDLNKVAIMERSGVQAKFTTYAGNPGSAKPEEQAPRHVCEMICDTTGAVIAKAEGDGRIVSFDKAIKQLDSLNRKPAMQTLADSNASLAAERDELKAKLAALSKPTK